MWDKSDIPKFGGFFNKKTVEKLSLVIEATLIGWPLTLSSSALKLTNISTFDCWGKPYENRMKCGIDVSEMSCGLRELFSRIEYAIP